MRLHVLDCDEHQQPATPREKNSQSLEVGVPIRKQVRTIAKLWYSSVNALAAASVCLLLSLIVTFGLFSLRSSPLQYIIIATIVVLILAWREVGRSSFHTARSSPTAPFAIVGGAVAASFILCSAAFGGLFIGGFASFSMKEPTCAALFSILLIVSVYRGTKRGLIARYGEPVKGIGCTCARCLYDLRGIPEELPCPECGHEFRFQWSLSTEQTNKPKQNTIEEL